MPSLDERFQAIQEARKRGDSNLSREAFSSSTLSGLRPPAPPSLEDRFRAIQEAREQAGPLPTPIETPVSVLPPNTTKQTPEPFYSWTEPNTVGRLMSKLLRTDAELLYNFAVDPFVQAGQVLREGRTPEQAHAFEAMTPEQQALYKESGAAYRNPMTQDVEPVLGPIFNLGLMGALSADPGGLGRVPSGRGTGFFGRRPTSQTSRKAPAGPPAATPSTAEEVARNTAHALRGERLAAQLAEAERLRQSPSGGRLLRQDLAAQQAEGQLRNLSGEAFPAPVSPSPPPTAPPTPPPPPRGPKALPAAKPLAVTPQGQVVPRMTRIRGLEATPEGLVPPEPSSVASAAPQADPLWATRISRRAPSALQSRAAKLDKIDLSKFEAGQPLDYLGQMGLSPENEANRIVSNLIMYFESAGEGPLHVKQLVALPKALNTMTKDSGMFQISPSLAKQLKLPPVRTAREQLQQFEQVVLPYKQRVLGTTDPKALTLGHLNERYVKSALAASKGVVVPPIGRPAAGGPKASLAVEPTTVTPRTPIPKTESAPEVQGRMQAIRFEAEHATGQPFGKQYGTVETEMGPQRRAVGAAKSFREQFADLYPEFRNLPDVGPKEIAEAIKKDKNNKLYTIIRDEVTQQLEREKITPSAIEQRPSDFDAFSQAVDELAAQEAATVRPPSTSASQPKLFQTQAEMSPEGLQAKAPQVEHGDLLAGLKKADPEPPRLPLTAGTAGRSTPAGESTVGAARYQPPPYTPEQLATGPGMTAIPPEIGEMRFKVLARPGFESMANQIELLFQGKLPNPDARFFRNVGAAIKRGDVVWPGQTELMREGGFTAESFGDEFLKSGTTWGRGLNMLSQWTKRVNAHLQDHPELADAIGTVAPPPEKPLSWFRRMMNTNTAIITGRISTAARNGEQGLSAIFLDALEQGVANVAVGAKQGNVAQGMAATMEQWSTILRGLNPKAHKELLSLLDAYPLGKLELLQTPIADIAVAKSKIIGGAPMANLLKWVQFLNRTQENYNRAIGFAGSVRGNLVLSGRSANTPSAAIPESIIQTGVQDGLRLTSAAQPEAGTIPGRLASGIMRMYDVAPILGFVNRFPKFQYANAFRFLWEHSPFGPLDLTTKGWKARETMVNMNAVKRATVSWSQSHGGATPSQEIMQQFYKDATQPTAAAKRAAADLANPKTHALAYTKSATGLMMLMAALAYRSSDDAPDHWYEINLPTWVPKVGGKPVSFEAFAPFITMNLFAEGIRKAVDLYGTQTMRETFNTIKKPPVIEQKDVMRGLVGLNRIAGTGLVFVDLLEKGGGWPRVQDFFDQFVGSWAAPLSSVKNLVAPVIPSEGVIRDVSTAFPLTGALRRNIPGLAETLPAAPSITRAEPRTVETPWINELTGLGPRTYTPLEHAVNRLGLSWYQLGPQTGVPEADLILRRTMGQILSRPYYTTLVTSRAFTRLPNLAQEHELRKQFSAARHAALQQLTTTHPTLYRQVYEQKHKKKLERLRSFLPPSPR